MDSLFGLGIDFKVLEELSQEIEFDPETGEIIDSSDTLKQLFEEISQELGDKLDNSVYIVKSIESSITAIDTEVKRLQARKKALTNKKEVLKSLMLGALRASGTDKLKTNFNSFSVRKSKSVDIINEELIGREFMRIKKDIDKTKISKVLKDGGTVEGASLIENVSINIR